MLLYLYQVFIYLIQPIIWLNLLWRSRKYKSYRKRWKERYGFCNNKLIPYGVLLHAVSVGETLAALQLVKALRHNHPKLPITVTTMTPSASALVLSKFGDDIQHVYLPYDLIGSIHRFLNCINPKLTIIMETELWPNLIFQLKKRNIPLIITNARLSEISAKRYQKIKCLTKKLLQNITIIAAQNQEDGERFIKLGLARKKLYITGNLKYDITISSELCLKNIKLRQQWAPNRPVWIASSTHEEENSIILFSHTKLLKRIPNLLLILVPRNPECFMNIKQLTKKFKLFYISRSDNLIPNDNTQVIIGDTIGELMLLYGISDIAFIGGSLVKKGGHNPLEAAIYSIPILMGPYTHNFKDICTKLKKEDGLITVYDSTSLIFNILYLIKNKNHRIYYGNKAAKVLYKNKGALQKSLKLIEQYLPRVN